MYCKGCNVSNICKIRDFIGNNSHIADIEVNNCIYKNNAQAISTHSVVNQPTIDVSSPVRAVRDFTEASRAASGEPINNDFKTIKITDLNNDDLTGSLLINCPTCGGKTVQDDLKNCDECGKIVCSICGTADGQTRRLYCETCWKELK